VTGLRVKAVAPITLPEDRLAWRAGRYRALGQAAGGLDVQLVNLAGPDAPPSLDSDDAVQASSALIRAEILCTDPAEYDVVLPDCVLDPGIAAEPDPGDPVPSTGILRLVGFQLAAAGRMFSAVTRNEVIGREFERRVAEYGLSDYFAGVDTIDGDLALVSDEREWLSRLRAVAERARAKKAGTIFNGCSAVDVKTAAVSGVFILDPTPTALRLLQAAAASGLYHRPGAG
jgi:Asp/Glu/hydantoin racemase